MKRSRSKCSNNTMTTTTFRSLSSTLSSPMSLSEPLSRLALSSSQSSTPFRARKRHASGHDRQSNDNARSSSFTSSSHSTAAMAAATRAGTPSNASSNSSSSGDAGNASSSSSCGGSSNNNGNHLSSAAASSSSSSALSLLKSTMTTPLSTLHSGFHGRQRREQREILKTDLQKAKKYGMAEPQPNGRTKHTWGGIVFIYDSETNQEVTCYKSDGRRQLPEQACSRYVNPVILHKHFVSPDDLTSMTAWASDLQQQQHLWKSHTVLVIDMSASMRLDDVRGALSRSDAVFLALARDFIGNPLSAGLLDKFHVVSLVIMRETAEVLIECQPVSWIVYNQLIDFREWSNLRPAGHGHYYPALTKAVEKLNINKLPGCSLSLFFCSDGVPSDPPRVVKSIPKLISDLAAQPWTKAQKLSVTCVGIGGLSLLQKQEAMQTSLSSSSRLRTADWTVLNSIVQAAKEQGAVATLELPSVNSCKTTSIVALSTTISSTLSSIASTAVFSPLRNSLSPSFVQHQHHHHHIHNESHRRLRNFERESLVAPDDDSVTSGGWTVFQRVKDESERFVGHIWSWDPSANNLVSIQRPQCVLSLLSGDSNHHDGHEGEMVCHDSAVPSFSAVAIKNAVFEEGAERVVRKIRFLDGDNNFVGGPCVAKESRFADDAAMEYFVQFMHTQALARKYASLFNYRLNALKESLQSPGKFHKWIGELPRMRFLDQFLLNFVDGEKVSHVLVEEMLTGGRFEKYNSNTGHVAGASHDAHIHRMMTSQSVSSFSSQDAVQLEHHHGRHNALDLPTIDEEEYDDDSLAERGREVVEKKHPVPKACILTNVSEKDFPQAFSHFTYEVTNGELMVVDLQGILKKEPDGRREFVLTDPAIHSRRQQQQPLLLGTFGRTDQGERGMRAFWDSHICSDACRLLGLVPQK